MDALRQSDPSDLDEGDARPRRDALAAWYGIPAETFTGFSETALDEILDAIRDTPSRWAGIPRTVRPAGSSDGAGAGSGAGAVSRA
jgi:hypothetical protein